MKNKLICPHCKDKGKIKTKINYPFGKSEKGKISSAYCKKCKRRII